MRKRVLIVLLLVALWAVIATAAQAQRASGRTSIEIDLQEQMAYLVRDGHVVLSSPIASGRIGKETTRGTFKITQKERNHFSNLYGKIVDAWGNTVVADADVDMPVPRGGRFVPAAMRYFLRYNGAEGMHAGVLPGYPASNGCVRLPEARASAFFRAVEIGTPVTVFGTTPRRRGRQQQWDYLGQRGR
jgi:lipoprotein-anchoring transpeptidase ErfK/SrfK